MMHRRRLAIGWRSACHHDGSSIYFHDEDTHLCEHTGTLAERLERYAKGRAA